MGRWGRRAGRIAATAALALLLTACSVSFSIGGSDPFASVDRAAHDVDPGDFGRVVFDDKRDRKDGLGVPIARSVIVVFSAPEPGVEATIRKRLVRKGFTLQKVDPAYADQVEPSLYRRTGHGDPVLASAHALTKDNPAIGWRQSSLRPGESAIEFFFIRDAI